MSRRSFREWWLSAPSLLWLLVLFVIPTMLVFTVSFRPSLPNGGVGTGWTLDTWREISNPNYPIIIWRTIWLSGLTAVVCIGTGIPIAYWLARLDARRRSWALLFIILPFWTNFLIRVFAWQTLLHPDGLVKQVLVGLGLAAPHTQLLYNSGAILMVLIYSYLPFAILPLYAAAEKFDFSLLDAARDLGAGRARAFFSIFVPGIRQGILTAVLVVLIPALGSYAIPDIVGGPNSEMIGNKIALRVFNDRNLPHASALSSILALAVLLPMILALLYRRGNGEKPTASGHP